MLRKAAQDKGSRSADVTLLDRSLADRLKLRGLNSTRSEAPKGSDEDGRMKIKVLGSYGSEGQKSPSTRAMSAGGEGE